MTDLIEKCISLINGFITQWTAKYLFQTSYLEETEQGHSFMTEFSLPTPGKPVPTATVKVYFYMMDLTDQREQSLKFRFENDSLIHFVDRTIRITQMEKWLEKILARKDRTSKILFLGTQFEETRVQDVNYSIQLSQNQKRMQDLFAEKPKPQILEEKFLLPELLQNPQELINQQVLSEEEKAKEIQLLREVLYQVFRQIDKDDLGMISHEECLNLFKLMGLNLNKLQQEEILTSLDITKTGIISYNEIVPLGAELIHAIFCKNQAIRDLQEKEEESHFQAHLMLITDQIQDIHIQIKEECVKLDEDETNFVTIDEFKEVLVKFPLILNTEEVDRVLDDLKVINPDKVKYGELETMFFQNSYNNLVQGLIEQDNTKLELYLLKILEPFDQLKNGFVHYNDIVTALRVSEKLMLSKVQLFIIQSFINQEKSGLVEYKKESKTLAKFIKKFFNIDLLAQKSVLQQNSKVDPNQQINPQSLEQTQLTLLTIGK